MLCGRDALLADNGIEGHNTVLPNHAFALTVNLGWSSGSVRDLDQKSDAVLLKDCCADGRQAGLLWHHF